MVHSLIEFVLFCVHVKQTTFVQKPNVLLDRPEEIGLEDTEKKLNEMTSQKTALLLHAKRDMF